MNDKLRILTGVSLALTLGLLSGCPGDDGTAEGTAGSSSTGDASGSSGPGMTSMPMTTTPADSGDSGTSTTTMGTTITTMTEESGPVCDDAELGAGCADPVCDCASDNCFVVGPLGGVCSECDESADCEATTGFGCNFGNPLTMTPAVCSTTGESGESCETADDCAAGLFCPTLIEVPGILTAATCSECESNDDCMGPDICAPTYDIANIGGNYSCVPPGSVPDGEGCNLVPGDGAECMSGNCAPAALQGIPVVAVCSPCNEDTDCGAGETCQLPEVAIAGTALELVPGACV